MNNSTEQTNGTPAEGEQPQDAGAEGPVDTVFQLKVKLPHEPYQTEIHASTLEQVQDIRQSIIETPYTFQYTCFHLEHNGQRVNDFVELLEVPGIGPES